MRRWTFSGAQSAANSNNNDDSNTNGDIEVAETPATRRATVTAAANERTFEEEVNLAIIYAQLNEAFGVDFGDSFGAFLVDGEVETVASTCTDPSQNGDDEEIPTTIGGGGGSANNGNSAVRRRSGGNTTYVLDPDTGITLPVATLVGDDEDEGCTFKNMMSLCFAIIMMFCVLAAIMFFLFIILS
mmetsp:Transcript_27713/g.49943  ORF Transcript_27713/g.49943 Transcript_27713/m.49943 type:complete len:186 (-) Transcript_27713:159-716(-)